MATEAPRSISFKCLKVSQPIGVFYIGSISSSHLSDLTWFDVRRIRKERDVETYLGIQRRLDDKRVEELKQYVTTVDACFPTAVILAVPSVCVQYDEATNMMTLSNYLEPDGGQDPIFYKEIAKVLDGQHRIAGLKDYSGAPFEINVSIFVDIDIAEQAYIFSTVNLAQTKVNKSLVYDLYDLAKSISPQKVCHNSAVALDEHENSPLFHRIKRLGVATEGRFNETITQATFVQSLSKYICRNELAAAKDRDVYMRGEVPSKANADELKIVIFRNMVIENKDVGIADILWNYFDAVKERWPQAWSATGHGIILNKTNGFRALMRFLRDAYLFLTAPGGIPNKEDFRKVFERVHLKDDDFNTDVFKPGTSGESTLYRTLKELSRITPT